MDFTINKEEYERLRGPVPPLGKAGLRKPPEMAPVSGVRRAGAGAAMGAGAPADVSAGGRGAHAMATGGSPGVASRGARSGCTLISMNDGPDRAHARLQSPRTAVAARPGQAAGAASQPAPARRDWRGGQGGAVMGASPSGRGIGLAKALPTDANKVEVALSGSDKSVSKSKPKAGLVPASRPAPNR